MDECAGGALVDSDDASATPMVSMSGLGWPFWARPLNRGTEAVCHFVNIFFALVVKAVSSEDRFRELRGGDGGGGTPSAGFGASASATQGSSFLATLG
jgi:hypothetical protein